MKPDEKITQDWLLKNNACEQALERSAEELNGGLPLSVVIRKLDRADWLLWLLMKTRSVNRRQCVWLAALSARRALRFVMKGEERPRLAIAAAEAWAKVPSGSAAAAAGDAAAAAWAAGDAAAAAWEPPQRPPHGPPGPQGTPHGTQRPPQRPPHGTQGTPHGTPQGPPHGTPNIEPSAKQSAPN